MEVQEQSQILYWLLFIFLPLILSIGGVVYKQIKDKEKAENRLTRIESNQNNNLGRLDKIEGELSDFKSEFRIIHEVKAQQEMTYKMVEKIEHRLENIFNNGGDK